MTALTDDPANGEIPLTITGQVYEIYSLSAKSVKLTGVVGKNIRETIHLVPSSEYPFTVKKVRAKRAQNIRFQLKEIKDAGGVQYDLTIENIATDPGVYFDTLYLETDSEITPQITITVVGRITAAESETAQKKEAPEATGSL